MWNNLSKLLLHKYKTLAIAFEDACKILQFKYSRPSISRKIEQIAELALYLFVTLYIEIYHKGEMNNNRIPS